MSDPKTSPTPPVVVLKHSDGEKAAAGHPWVYEGGILKLIGEPVDGGVVQVKDNHDHYFGTGFYNSKSKIRVRILTSARAELAAAFFEEKIRAAIAFRQRHFPKATSYRLINAEGDFLSGLIVDKYEDLLVLQTSSLGMDQRKGMIVEILRKLVPCRAILERNAISSRKFEGLAEQEGIISGTVSDDELQSHVIDLNGIKFAVNLKTGHKTGFYLDQQANYQLTADYLRFLPSANVLDCFTFAGGFSLHCARAGAASVLGLDQSADAVTRATDNAARNGLTGNCRFEAANVFDWLKDETGKKDGVEIQPRFDLIILDPPSFTRTRSTVDDALRGYKEIHLRALRLLKKGGILSTFCCSHHVDAELFESVILDAAFDARKTLRRVGAFTQSPDHPVVPVIRETEYLKGYAFELA